MAELPPNQEPELSADSIEQMMKALPGWEDVIQQLKMFKLEGHSWGYSPKERTYVTVERNYRGRFTVHVYFDGTQVSNFMVDDYKLAALMLKLDAELSRPADLLTIGRRVKKLEYETAWEHPEEMDEAEEPELSDEAAERTVSGTSWEQPLVAMGFKAGVMEPDPENQQRVVELVKEYSDNFTVEIYQTTGYSTGPTDDTHQLTIKIFHDIGIIQQFEADYSNVVDWVRRIEHVFASWDAPILRMNALHALARELREAEEPRKKGGLSFRVRQISDNPEPEDLERLIDGGWVYPHCIPKGARVRINTPNSRYHGTTGVVLSASSGSAYVRIDHDYRPGDDPEDISFPADTLIWRDRPQRESQEDVDPEGFVNDTFDFESTAKTLGFGRLGDDGWVKRKKGFGGTLMVVLFDAENNFGKASVAVRYSPTWGDWRTLFTLDTTDVEVLDALRKVEQIIANAKTLEELCRELNTLDNVYPRSQRQLPPDIGVWEALDPDNIDDLEGYMQQAADRPVPGDEVVYDKDEAEQKAQADYEASAGKFFKVPHVDGYENNDSVTVRGPFTVRVLPGAQPRDVVHWNDEYLDPFWEVEIVSGDPEAMERVGATRNHWIHGKTYHVPKAFRGESAEDDIGDLEGYVDATVDPEIALRELGFTPHEAANAIFWVKKLDRRTVASVIVWTEAHEYAPVLGLGPTKPSAVDFRIFRWKGRARADLTGGSVYAYTYNTTVQVVRERLAEYERTGGKLSSHVGVGESEVPTAKEITAAAKEADPSPTDDQIEAENYRKGHLQLYGLDISIENAKGAERSGKDADGKPWSVTMPAHYGYVKGTMGKDGDHVDVYIGDSPEARKVWVVDQQDAKTGAFDEHKCLLCFPTKDEAEKTYIAGFSDGKGKERLGAMTEMSVDEFVEWLEDGDTKKPVGESDEVAPEHYLNALPAAKYLVYSQHTKAYVSKTGTWTDNKDEAARFVRYEEAECFAYTMNPSAPLDVISVLESLDPEDPEALERYAQDTNDPERVLLPLGYEACDSNHHGRQEWSKVLKRPGKPDGLILVMRRSFGGPNTIFDIDVDRAGTGKRENEWIHITRSYGKPLSELESILKDTERLVLKGSWSTFDMHSVDEPVGPVREAADELDPEGYVDALVNEESTFRSFGYRYENNDAGARCWHKYVPLPVPLKTGDGRTVYDRIYLNPTGAAQMHYGVVEQRHNTWRSMGPVAICKPALLAPMGPHFDSSKLSFEISARRLLLRVERLIRSLPSGTNSYSIFEQWFFERMEDIKNEVNDAAAIPLSHNAGEMAEAKLAVNPDDPEQTLGDHKPRFYFLYYKYRTYDAPVQGGMCRSLKEAVERAKFLQAADWERKAWVVVYEAENEETSSTTDLGEVYDILSDYTAVRRADPGRAEFHYMPESADDVDPEQFVDRAFDLPSMLKRLHFWNENGQWLREVVREGIVPGRLDLLITVSERGSYGEMKMSGDSLYDITILSGRGNTYHPFKYLYGCTYINLEQKLKAVIDAIAANKLEDLREALDPDVDPEHFIDTTFDEGAFLTANGFAQASASPHSLQPYVKRFPLPRHYTLGGMVFTQMSVHLADPDPKRGHPRHASSVMVYLEDASGHGFGVQSWRLDGQLLRPAEDPDDISPDEDFDIMLSVRRFVGALPEALKSVRWPAADNALAANAAVTHAFDTVIKEFNRVARQPALREESAA